MAVDSQWSDVVLLLPLTDDTDDARPHTVNVNGGAVIASTVGNLFGAGNALYLDGVNNYITATSADFALGTGDFSIQFGIYPISGGHGGAYSRILQIGPDATNGSLYIVSNNLDNPMTLLIQHYSGGYVNTIDYVATTISNSAWHYIQLDRVAGSFFLYVDGSLYSAKATSISFSGTTLSIGCNTTGGGPFNGYIGPIRITKGSYRTDHSTPASAFPRPTISGTVYDSVGAKASKVVVALDRSSMTLAKQAVSDATLGTYTIYPYDYSEHVTIEFDTATYPLVDGGSGENALIYDRVIPG